MFHFVASARPGRLLVHDWVEAARLFVGLSRALPGANALCVMPNHVHLQHPQDVAVRFRTALVGYLRWRNARRGERGPVLVRPLPPPVRRVGEDKIRRDARYISLNACRAGLVRDPLAWPYASHRDACGLAIPPIRRRVGDASPWHRYVSSDPSVAVQGTLLPVAPTGIPTLTAVRDAVSATTRTLVADLERRGPARTLLVGVAKVLTSATQREIGELTGLDVRTVRRMRPARGADLATVSAVIGDPRFPALFAGERAWRDLPREGFDWLLDD